MISYLPLRRVTSLGPAERVSSLTVDGLCALTDLYGNTAVAAFDDQRARVGFYTNQNAGDEQQNAAQCHHHPGAPGRDKPSGWTSRGESWRRSWKIFGCDAQRDQVIGDSGLGCGELVIGLITRSVMSNLAQLHRAVCEFRE